MNPTPDALTLRPLRATAQAPHAARVSRVPTIGVARWFYVIIAVSYIVIAVGGFLPSYFIKVSNHTFALPAIYHVHAALFFSWTLLNAAQAWFVATGRVYNHRNWGLLGISLATAMAISVVLLIVTGIKLSEAHGMALPAKRFAFLSFSGVVKFTLLFGAAIYFVHRRELHKRLMVIANCNIISAPIGRLVAMSLPAALRAGPPPAGAVIVILLLGYWPVIAGMLFDWRTRGRPHPIYLVGVLSLAAGLLVPLISRSDAWLTTIDHLVNLMG
jgi:hypothetical protein